MEYLLLVCLGVVITRYILPVLDVVLELVNYWLARFANNIVLDTQREQLKFKKEVEAQTADNSPKIGFRLDPKEEYDEFDEEFEDEEFEEEENCNTFLGSIKSKIKRLF